jgi:multicomponent Na+:H+ antiporter subunit D
LFFSVALELLTFAAVPLVCLDGRAETLAAAFRYLLFALFGSVFYLLGTALLYGGYGTLDIALLFGLVGSEPVTFTAVGLMTAGLLASCFGAWSLAAVLVPWVLYLRLRWATYRES